MKKKTLKRICVAALSAVLMMGLMTGCNGENVSTESSQESSVESTESQSASSSESVEDTESTESTEASESEESSAEALDESSPAISYAEAFKAELANSDDLEKVTAAVLKNYSLAPYKMDYHTVEEGYLNGFNSEINGFNHAVCFGPVISTIPFIGYIFETDDVDALSTTVDENAALNWNICTMADVKYLEKIDDKHLFFIMTPANYEE